MLVALRNFLRFRDKPKNHGYCPICEKNTVFVEREEWLRDHYLCLGCYSIPRQRALLKVLQEKFPGYSDLSIHESSPSGPASKKLKIECHQYVPSHFYPDLEPGKIKDGFRCENLEKMTFSDEIFDLVITQDVMEHVLNPQKAFSEIARTLKRGGAHVFTVPLYSGRKTEPRAQEVNGEIVHLKEPTYHGNPIDKKGSLVVTEWGDDMTGFIKESCGLDTEIFSFKDRKFGLDAEFLDVFVTSKSLEIN